jgi:hypothetical protein
VPPGRRSRLKYQDYERADLRPVRVGPDDLATMVDAGGEKVDSPVVTTRRRHERGAAV